MLNHLIAQLVEWATLFIPYLVNKCKEAMYPKITKKKQMKLIIIELRGSIRSSFFSFKLLRFEVRGYINYDAQNALTMSFVTLKWPIFKAMQHILPLMQCIGFYLLPLTYIRAGKYSLERDKSKTKKKLARLKGRNIFNYLLKSINKRPKPRRWYGGSVNMHDTL